MSPPDDHDDDDDDVEGNNNNIKPKEKGIIRNFVDLEMRLKFFFKNRISGSKYNRSTNTKCQSCIIRVCNICT